jgi:drug/metabolite transporter superfamily protein YnfA
MDVVDGATAMACCAIALFFLRFWRETHDRLFAIFALAFAIFAVNRVILTTLSEEAEGRVAVYAARFVAFALIALAILDKNRAPD